ncbi:MAG: hypothetical protein L6R36_004065 [Xanthoria steineri]|nr:MAG: hypothetical protein L6R36_004065 [Xanthoria steineri]
MSSSKLAALVATLASIASVSAHGKVSGIVAGGVYHPGYTINYAYSPTHPPLVAWSVPEDKDTGYINPGNFSNPDIICHKGATPGELYATVAAGSTVELQWTDWPESHHGPVIDYLANCNGECTSADKTALKFNKIAAQGMFDHTAQPGNWASDKLIAANNSWTVTIPKNVAPGNYVLRHEIIALHSANNKDGAQNYPQCVNLKVTGSGTDKLAAGTPGMELYKPDDAGIFVNIYDTLPSYSIPGPKLHSGASSPSSDPPTTSKSTSAGYGPPSTTSSSSPEETAPGNEYGSTSSQEAAASSSSSSPTTLPPYPTPTSNSTTTTFPIIHQQPSSTKPTKKPCTTKPKSTSLPTSIPETQPTAPVSTPTTTPSAPSNEPETEPEPEPETEPSTTNPTNPPSKPNFSSMTTADLFAWLDMIVAELKSRLGGTTRKIRRHTRDFVAV